MTPPTIIAAGACRTILRRRRQPTGSPPPFPLRHHGTSSTRKRRPPIPVPITQRTLPPNCPQSILASALRPSHEARTPLHLRGPYSGSDAVHCWRSLDYLTLAVGADAPCHVEVGRSYADPDMDKPEVPFGQYVEYVRSFEGRYGREGSLEEGGRSGNGPGASGPPEPKREEIMYLAQNELFPGLRSDLTLPALCNDPSFGVGLGHMYSAMIWFGPRGCVSPLHYDPLDNLLVQAVGRKRIWLYPRTEVGRGEEDGIRVAAGEGSGGASNRTRHNAEWCYAGADGMQYNTSAVNVEDVDWERYPRFADAPPPVECVLRPGDVLFIPAKWWHHVRSFDTSVSVNVWWR